jgi:hypothetical protein
MITLVRKAFLCAAILFLLPGCGQLTQTITLNPDGKGKVIKDMYVPAIPFDFGGILGGGEPKETPLDDVKKAAAASLVANTKGVTAWKDVSVSWTNDGRLRMVGTAYFDRLEDMAGLDLKDLTAFMNPSGLIVTLFSSMQAFEVTVEKDELKIAAKKSDALPLNDALKFKGQPALDFATMNDKEQDEYILKQRVMYQLMKPMLSAMLAEFKLKTVIHLPGEAQDIKGFKQDNPSVVSQTLDGNEMLQGMKKLMSKDSAALKKMLKAGGNAELFQSFGLSSAENTLQASLTVRKIGKAQFDYDKEVEAARAAYPELRKKLNLGEDTKLPGEK